MASRLDEITTARKQRLGKIRRKRIIIVLCFVLVLSTIYIAVTSYSEISSKDMKDSINSFFASGNYPLLLDDNVKMIRPADSCMALLSQSMLTTAKGSGSLIQSSYHGLTNAELASNSNRILVYSQSGKSYRVYNRSYLLFSGNTEFEISSACVNTSGKYCILTRGDEYTSELHVYNKDTSKRFTWYGTDGFPISVIPSESDDNVAVFSMKGSGGRIITVVTLINLSTQKEVNSFNFEGLYVDAIYDGDTLALLMDTRALLVKSDGTLQAEYNYNGRQLLNISHQEGNNVILAFGDNMRSEINSFEVLNKKMNMTAHVDYHKEIHDIWVDSDEIYVLSRGEVDVYTTQGSLKRIYPCSTSAYSIYEWDGPVVIEAQYAVKLTESVAPGGDNSDE